MSLLDSLNISEAMKKNGEKELDEFKEVLLVSFDRHAKELGVAPNEVQFAIRMADEPNGNGTIYYQLMTKWKPLRNANFSIDFVGGTLPMDTTGKENFITLYLCGASEFGLPSQYERIAAQYGVKKWGQISIIFYRPKSDLTSIKAAVYITPEAGGAPKEVEKIDIFA